MLLNTSSLLLNTSSLALDTCFVVVSGSGKRETYVVYVLQEDGWESVPVKSKNKSSKA
jgi:hypothetical protein